jgi:hypothetical protein
MAAYTFKHRNKSYSVPDFSQVSMGVIRKARKGEDDLDKAFIIIEELLGEDSPELKALDQMSPAEFQTFLEGWTQGASLGES